MTAHSRFPPKSDAGGNFAIACGQRLIHVRGQESQSDFASKIGAHKNTYGSWERGRTDIAAASLAALVGLGWNANWLLTGQGPERLDAAEPLQPAVQSQSHEVSRKDLTIAIALAQAKIEDARRDPTPEQFAEFVAEIYAAITQGLPEADVHHINTNKRKHQGEGNAGGQGVAKTG